MGSLKRKHTPVHSQQQTTDSTRACRSLVLTQRHTAHEITAMKRRAGHNMLMLSALPWATAFTNVRRRFQPRVVLRGKGTEQLGAVAAPGVRVRAPWTNGQLYPGQVTSVEGDKVSIKFDDGDQREGVTWKHCQVGAAADDVPEPAVGVRVMAPWKNRHMYPGRVGAVSKSKDKVKINFDDGDELVVPWAACRLRDAPRTSTYSFKRPQSLSVVLRQLLVDGEDVRDSRLLVQHGDEVLQPHRR